MANCSWHWDGEGPAGSPASFVIRGLDAATPLQANEAELLSEVVMQYGNVPAGDASHYLSQVLRISAGAFLIVIGRGQEGDARRGRAG